MTVINFWASSSFLLQSSRPEAVVLDLAWWYLFMTTYPNCGWYLRWYQKSVSAKFYALLSNFVRHRIYTFMSHQPCSSLTKNPALFVNNPSKKAVLFKVLYVLEQDTFIFSPLDYPESTLWIIQYWNFGIKWTMWFDAFSAHGKVCNAW